MLAILQRRRVDLAAAIALIVGLCILSTPQVSRFVLPLRGDLRGYDIVAWWQAATSLVNGLQVFPYHDIPDFFYPAPYVVLFTPLALFSTDTARVLAQVGTAIGMVGVIAFWAWREGGHDAGDGHIEWPAWLLGLSLPVVVAVYLGQLSTTIGLVAFTVAVWAQRKGLAWLVGAAAAVGAIRLGNALPIIAMLAVGMWGKPRQLVVAAISAAVVLLPMIVVTTLWYPDWASDYLHFVGDYRWGLPAVMRGLVGPAGNVLVQAVACGIAVFLVRRYTGRPLDLDRAAAVIAVTMLVAPLTAAYTAAFALPAVIRASMRPRMRLVIAIALVVPWLSVFGPENSPLAPFVLGPVLAAIIGLISIRPLLHR
ncbi:MAG: hypothetical protein M3O87_04905 [Candidatus Dormibacteraeota bacterium]|nr:hypothetical protein [Candidatus Dormibacteraeota bacterium]